ncbi:MAG: hypothetical protein IJY35_04390 [Clostridia bacterium]|nr:hypothetical protein [Clostridia bacterium]
MKDHIRNTFYLTVCHIGGIMLGMLVMFILLNPVRMITTDTSARAWIHFAIQNIATFAALFILFGRIGESWNRAGESLLPKSIVIGNTIAVLAVFLLILISYFEFILLYQNTAWLIDALYAEFSVHTTVGINEMKSTYLPQTLGILAVHTVLYLIPMNLGYYSGAKKRAGERAKLHHE